MVSRLILNDLELSPPRHNHKTLLTYYAELT